MGQRGGRAAEALRCPLGRAYGVGVGSRACAAPARVLLPWYALQEGLDSGVWLSGLWSSEDYASRPRSARRARASGGWRPCCWRSLACSRSRCCLLERERRGTMLLFASVMGHVLFLAQPLHRPALLDGGLAERPVRRAGGAQVGIGAGGALVLIALLSLLSIRSGVRCDFGGDVFVAGAGTTVALRSLAVHRLADPAHPAAGLPGRRRRLHAGAADRPAGGREDLEPALPHRRRPLRRGVEHAVPGAGLRRRHDGAGAGLRADRRRAPPSPTRRRCACSPCCRSSRRPS